MREIIAKYEKRETNFSPIRKYLKQILVQSLLHSYKLLLLTKSLLLFLPSKPPEINYFQ